MVNLKNIPKSFIGFLVLATLIWLIINLSKVYTAKFSFNVNYTNLPQDKVMLTDPLTLLNTKISGTGFKLFWFGVSKRIISVPLHTLTHKKGKSYYILPNILKNNIQNQLAKDITLIEVLKDTLFFELGQLSSKKVPLKPNVLVNYKLGYDATKITITPDSVTITGAKEQLKTINELSLEQFTAQELSTNIHKDLNILFPKKNSNIKIDNTKANLNIEVDKFTQGEFTIPVTIKNGISKRMTIYPKTVKVSFKVGLNNYSKITPELFEVSADYTYAKENDLNFMLVQLNVKSNLVNSVRVVPEKIDFLIHK